jgi:hypothetical protein
MGMYFLLTLRILPGALYRIVLSFNGVFGSTSQLHPRIKSNNASDNTQTTQGGSVRWGGVPSRNPTRRDSSSCFNERFSSSRIRIWDSLDSITGSIVSVDIDEAIISSLASVRE